LRRIESIEEKPLEENFLNDIENSNQKQMEMTRSDYKGGDQTLRQGDSTARDK